MEIKSFKDGRKIIATGVVMSKNPVDYVGDQELGDGFIEIHVEVAVHNTEPLIRPYGVYKTIGDAVGKPIAWPEYLVSWSIYIKQIGNVKLG